MLKCGAHAMMPCAMTATAKCTTTAGSASDVVREEQEQNEKNKKDAEEAARQKEARYDCARFCPAPAPNLSSLQQEQLAELQEKKKELSMIVRSGVVVMPC